MLLASGWSPHSLSSELSDVMCGDVTSSSKSDSDLSLPLVIGVKMCFGSGLTLLLSSHDTWRPTTATFKVRVPAPRFISFHITLL